jgi:hypothetical protein
MRGGIRPNAGRPKGSTNKFKITEYMTPEEIDRMVKLFLSQAKRSPQLMRFLMEQIFGKAIQQSKISGFNDEPIVINMISYKDAVVKSD